MTDKKPTYGELEAWGAELRVELARLRASFASDLNELELARDEHSAHHYFYESLDRINRVILRATDVEGLLDEVIRQPLFVLFLEHLSYQSRSSGIGNSA